MANHYLDFSFSVPLTPERIKEVSHALKIVQDDKTDWRPGAEAEDPELVPFEQAFPQVASHPGGNVAQTALMLYAHLAAAIDDPDDIEASMGCPSLSGLVFDSGAQKLYVYTQEYGSVDGAAAILCALQARQFIGPMGFGYAEYCSKPRTNEFHGGAVWVENGEIERTHTVQWLHANEQKAKKEAETQTEQTPAFGAGI